MTRLGKLGITEQKVMMILRNPDELLYDALTNRFVAISWSHNTAAIYDEKANDDLIVITVKYTAANLKKL